MLFVPSPVEFGYGCLVLLASNVFVRTQPYLLFLNKNNAPHECGNPKCKVIVLGWLSDERFPRACSTSAGCFWTNRIAGARKLLASVANAEQHQLECVVPGNAPVKAVALYTNWLAPGFLSDWQEHSSILVQTAPSNFLAKASRVSVSATPA